MTKVYPALIAPVFLILDWQRGRRVAHLSRMAAAFAATCLLVALPLLVVAPTSLVRLYAYHADRGIQLESVFSSIALAIWRFSTTPMRAVLNFGSWNLAGPVPDRLAAISGPVLALVLLVTYAFIFLRTRRLAEGAIRHVRLVATCSALVLLVRLLGSKVLSPQYLIWLVTLVPLVVAPRRMTVLTLFTLVGVATYYIYPRHYSDLRAFLDSGVAALDVRNTLLMTLTVIVANALRLATLPAAAELSRAAAGGPLDSSRVRLADYLAPSRVLVPLACDTLGDARSALLERLGASGAIADLERLSGRVAEERGEDMVAIADRAFLLHYRTDTASALQVAIGVCPGGVRRVLDDGTEQRAPVVVIVVGPPRSAARQLQVVRAFGRLLPKQEVIDALLASPSPEAVVRSRCSRSMRFRNSSSCAI